MLRMLVGGKIKFILFGLEFLLWKFVRFNNSGIMQLNGYSDSYCYIVIAMGKFDLGSPVSLKLYRLIVSTDKIYMQLKTT